MKFIDSPKPSVAQHSSGLFKRLKDEMSADSEDEIAACMMISSKRKMNEPCYAEVFIENRRLTMEVDCGSAESVVSEELYLRNYKHCPIEMCKKRLFVIDGNKLDILGKVRVAARMNGRRMDLYLVVLRCEKDFIPLMGRTWLDVFYEGWRNTFSNSSIPKQRVNALTEDQTVEDIKSIAWRQSDLCASATN